ncbi:MAG: Hsp70 family protein, partial [archaeon]
KPDVGYLYCGNQLNSAPYPVGGLTTDYPFADGHSQAFWNKLDPAINFGESMYPTSVSGVQGERDLAFVIHRERASFYSPDIFLGGKNIDWDIVEKIIIPRILEKFKLTNLKRKNKEYGHIFPRLKYCAESAKIELSQYKRTKIEIEDIGKDELGKNIELSIDFSRQELESLISQIIDRTISLTKETLKESGIKSALVKRIVLVGGPTQMPFLQERLEKELGIKVDSSVDPLTVVARGACVFAMGQRIPKKFLKDSSSKQKVGTHKITLNHTTLTSDDEESVTGIVEGLDEKETYYIQIQSDSGTFTGQKTKLNNGKFYYPVNLEPNRNNLFWVYIFDSKGKPIKLSQDSFTVTHGLSVSGAPIPHSIGVVVASRDFTRNQLINTCEKIFEKGAVLPLKKMLDVYKTSRKLKKGEDASLDIDIVEGESEIPDRNTYLCKTGIKGRDLPHDLPAGTPIELTLEMNESRELVVTVYIPLIDLTANARSTLKDELVDVEKMNLELESQRARAEQDLEDCSIEERKEIVDKIQSVSQSIDRSENDEDEKRKASKQLKDLKIVLDKVEEEKRMPQLIKEYNAIEENVQKIINEYADPKEREEYKNGLKSITSEGKKAINDENKALLIRVIEQLLELRQTAIFSNPATWVNHFREIVALNNFINEKEAQYYIKKGEAAIEAGDLEELKRCARQLILLLPKEEQRKISGISR